MQSTLTWQDIDPAELPKSAQDAYADYKASYRAMKAAKEQFETLARASIPTPAGFEVKFGYNFGKLGIALAPVSDKPKAKAKLSLAAWIEQQASAGART